MYIGGYLLLIVVGALLRWAVTFHWQSFDIQTAGLILVVVGILGVAVTVLFWFDGRGYAAPWRRSRYAEDDLPYAPPVHERIIHEHVIREEPDTGHVVRELPPRERVVREYVPPPRDAEDEQPPPLVDDDTVESTADRTAEPTHPVSGRPAG